ncbi:MULTISPECIES: type II secretion system F family protein [Kocuria]|uniref:type II secretion system F family protein n=1 Tax=Kocuria TaxID=57493 RepID=UPI0008A1F181|nr:type II secretion system F family protein [Kocuria sp. HMSC066H03]OFK06368.1 type II secretion system protein [Kocuria sp. HMSC066H03]
MIAAVLAGLLAAGALLLWMSPGASGVRSRGPGRRRRAAGGSAPRRTGAGTEEHSFPALPAAALVELTACQLDAGLPLAEAVGVLADSSAGRPYPALSRAAAALRLGLSWETAWPREKTLPQEIHDYRDALEFTATSATASASVLRGQAELVRRAEYRRAERAAEALAVKLVLPLGLCFLPAFMCWGVVPVLMSLLPRAFGS